MVNNFLGLILILGALKFEFVLTKRREHKNFETEDNSNKHIVKITTSKRPPIEKYYETEFPNTTVDVNLEYMTTFTETEYEVPIIPKMDGGYETSPPPTITTESSSNADYNLSSTTRSGRVVQVVLEKCPRGMNYYENLDIFPFCYVLTEPQTFPPKCPYENYLEHEAVTAIYKEYQDVGIWVRARRDSENALGQYEWLDPSTRYLDLVKEYENPVDLIAEKKCMIQKGDSLIPVLCREKHPGLCVYSYSKTTIEKFCSKRNDFYRCISTSLNLDNKCYCMGIVEGMKKPRKSFCDKLAEPREPFQSTLILTQLVHKAPCWFGLDQSSKAELLWTSDNTSVGYSYMKHTDSSRTIGAFDYAKPKGWIFAEDNSLSCAICELEVDYRQVRIKLRHIARENQIEIRIQNVVDIHNYFLLSYVFACFTDSNSNGFRQKIISSITDIFSVNEQNYTRTVNVENNFPSYYWCETIQRPMFARVYSNKILVYKDEGVHKHEYALLVSVFVPKGTEPYLEQLHVTASSYIYDKLSETVDFVNLVRPMRTVGFSEAEEYFRVLLHMSTKTNELTAIQEYDELFKILNLIPQEPDSSIKEVLTFFRSEVCLESETDTGNSVLHWPETLVGMTVLPKELCLKTDSRPVVRKCEGDFLGGASWADVKGECADVRLSDKTVTLHEMLNAEDIPPLQLSHKLLQISKDKEEILTVDVHLMSEILTRLSAKCNEIKVEEIVEIMSNIMEFDRHVLKDAQVLLNSTDKALHDLDVILQGTPFNYESDHMKFKSDKLVVQMSDMRTSQITGMSIHAAQTDEEIVLVTKPLYEVNLTSLLAQEMDAAVFLPPELVEQIQTCFEFLDEKTPIKLIISFFYDDTLFNEAVSNEKSNSRVISVYIPNLDCEFQTPLKMIFKPFKDGQQLDCSHWKYGSNDAMENLRGKWKSDNIVTNNSVPNEHNYILCQFSHTTHFALLMLNVDQTETIPPESDLALNIITAIGCGLSLIGLAGIFITAILFKSWRKRAHNLIMLNFSVSLAAQMILLFVSDNARENSLACLISGASLHYTVLSEFAWMLIVAILQYRKFVLVFQKPISRLMLKCMLGGWCLPIIPVGIFLELFPEGYHQNTAGLCYPENKYFYLGVVTPVGTIVVINLCVFIKILLNVCCRKVESYGGHRENEVKLQVLLAILLFFLLGMSWIFGLVATFTGYLLMSYLFCLTATLQGFVIFVFFVVMNKKSRLLWLNVKRVCFCMDMAKQFR